MNDTVFLRVNGREWGGWESVRISAGVDRIARDFNVTISRTWPGATEPTPQVKNGDKVEVLLGADLVITGWIEATPVRYDASSISLGIVGRSKTADLVDCTAAPLQKTGATLADIAAALAQPFGVSVINDGAPATAVIEAQPQHGEKVVDCLNRLLGQVQALAYDNEKGELVLGSVGSGKCSTALVLGENILTCDTERSIKDCFSEYLVTGQRPGTNDDFGRATIAAIKQSATDATVTRYRPYTIQQSGPATSATCKARCEFEAVQRAAKMRETTYTVQGWRQGNGDLWRPNYRVIVFDPLCGFENEELVIGEVTFSKDEKGTTTELRVAPAEAYLSEPPSPKKGKKKKQGVVF